MNAGRPKTSKALVAKGWLTPCMDVLTNFAGAMSVTLLPHGLVENGIPIENPKRLPTQS